MKKTWTHYNTLLVKKDEKDKLNDSLRHTSNSAVIVNTVVDIYKRYYKLFEHLDSLGEEYDQDVLNTLNLEKLFE